MSTAKIGHRVSREVREQILKRIKDEGLPVLQASEEHGVSTKTIYSWLTKGTSKNPSWVEVAKLKKQNQELLALVGEITMKLSQAQKKS
jgi:transposase-like protein